MPADQTPHSGSSQPLPGDRVWVFRGILVLFFAYLLFRSWQARNLPYSCGTIVRKTCVNQFCITVNL